MIKVIAQFLSNFLLIYPKISMNLYSFHVFQFMNLYIKKQINIASQSPLTYYVFQFLFPLALDFSNHTLKVGNSFQSKKSVKSPSFFIMKIFVYVTPVFLHLPPLPVLAHRMKGRNLES